MISYNKILKLNYFASWLIIIKINYYLKLKYSTFKILNKKNR